MKELSIMIDEAGNFNMTDNEMPFYCITLVFHEQEINITQKILKFDNILSQFNFLDKNIIHTGPLIRRKFPYENMNLDDRKRIVAHTTAFTSHLPIKYKTFIFNKNQSDTYNTFLYKMTKEIEAFIEEHLGYFSLFDKIKLYYDKGQKEVSELLNNTFEKEFKPNTEMKLAYQYDYKLLQVADFICTLEFMKKKWDDGFITNSDLSFFGTRRKFIQNYYNKIKNKQLS